MLIMPQGLVSLESRESLHRKVCPRSQAESVSYLDSVGTDIPCAECGEYGIAIEWLVRAKLDVKEFW